MLVRSKKRWEIPERDATPEGIFMNRRAFLGAGAAAIGSATALAGPLAGAALAAEGEIDPSAHLYPVSRNGAYVLDRDITDETAASIYNNFYEFGSHKQISEEAQSLNLRPWDIMIDGMVEEPQVIAIDDLLAKMPLEERLYRHRCVEAWAMAVPWSGFPMSAFVEFIKPTAGARYIRMETFHDPDMARGQRQSWYPWPYVEGLTLEEANNELAFLATGIYGKPMPKQHGSTVRLIAPWKYGFKNIKSVVRFHVTDQQPVSFWESVQAGEYGFWANVNPDVPHPRWSQKTERLLGSNDRVPTQLYNGYAAEVAHLYKDMGLPDEVLFR